MQTQRVWMLSLKKGPLTHGLQSLTKVRDMEEKVCFNRGLKGCILYSSESVMGRLTIDQELNTKEIICYKYNPSIMLAGTMPWVQIHKYQGSKYQSRTTRYRSKHAEYKKKCSQARLWSWRDLQQNLGSMSDMNMFKKIIQSTKKSVWAHWRRITANAHYQERTPLTT